jgi:1,4-alpha-glucan branching enzyme
MIKKKYARDTGICTVTFIIGTEQAAGHESFNLVGDFNNWSKTDTPLKKKKDGTFEISLALVSGKEYQFRYLVDDSHWENDWNADKYVLNPYGNEENSVILI